MRALFCVGLLLTLIGCGKPATQPESIPTCLIGATYESGSDASTNAWTYLQENQERYLESEIPVSGLWHSASEGRASFRYSADCTTSMSHAREMLDVLADQAPPEVQSVLRAARLHEMTQAQFEGREPWPR